MGDYKSPNIYIEEIQSLPPSVVQGATAVPVFIGYTEKAGKEYHRITNMMEYENIFGKQYFPETSLEEMVKQAQDSDYLPQYLLYYQLQIHFANGGGDCYIISSGAYPEDGKVNAEDFNAQHISSIIAKEDEITLVILTDAIKLEKDAYYTLCNSILTQCAKLKDKFLILDIHGNDLKGDISDFRDKIRANALELKYGAAYYPYLNTTIPYGYDENKIKVKLHPTETPPINFAGGEVMQISEGFKNAIEQMVIAHNIRVEKKQEGYKDFKTAALNFKDRRQDLINALFFGIESEESASCIEVLDDQVNAFIQSLNFESSNTYIITDKKGKLDKAVDTLIQDAQTLRAQVQTLAELKNNPKTSKIYFERKAELDKLSVTLPPSGAIAGIYCSVDRQRGVWKAPANVSINAVIKPSVKISDSEQDKLNVDNSGKSINAIRSFTGKGTLVWGSRTLAGNDNEWRYVPVRRLFNTIEKSIKSSTAFAVFEPNDENTWLKVKLMIDNYLRSLWSQGALAGTKPEDAYYVHVGLGTTMSAQDILEGKLITKVGIAAVRPAEFIIMQFSHLLQKS